MPRRVSSFAVLTGQYGGGKLVRLWVALPWVGLIVPLRGVKWLFARDGAISDSSVVAGSVFVVHRTPVRWIGVVGVVGDEDMGSRVLFSRQAVCWRSVCPRGTWVVLQ